MTENKVLSPTIEKLRRSLKLGNIEAGVHGFWRHIGGVGSPLRPFGAFIVDELLPWIHNHYSVRSDPAECTVAGASYGGVAALWLGLEYPHVFSNVVSQSGAFYWNDDWLIDIIRGMDSVPLNVQLEVGSLEPDMLLSASERMHEALKGKTYSLELRHTTGGHHYGYWGETLMVALSRIKG